MGNGGVRNQRHSARIVAWEQRPRSLLHVAVFFSTTCQRMHLTALLHNHLYVILLFIFKDSLGPF